MHLCRNAWQKLAPLTQRGTAALLRNASIRQMSSSSVPGSSGDTLPYYLLVAVATAGGGFYAYRTLTRDKARFHDRHEFIHTQLRPAFDDYETKSNKEETSAVPETIEEAVEAAIEEAAAEEAAAEEATEQEAGPVPTLEQEPAAAEEETASAPTEQEPEPSTEAASAQVESDNTESVGETLEETSPVLETSSDNIIEELASAAEDWSELTARKPEETVDENAPVAEENEETVEAEQASASS